MESPFRISFKTVGCRLNQYETEKMAADLDPFGFQRVKPGEAADLYIINTCTVTHKAERDCRNLVRKARRDNPDARIVMVGCYVEKEGERLLESDDVDVILYNKEKDSIADILRERLPQYFKDLPQSAVPQHHVDVIERFHQRNRAWIKISDGCNQTCSFCLVTTVRGELINRPSEEILDEVRRLVDHGYREIVLTGVNAGYYRDLTAEPKVGSTAALCGSIIERTTLRRLRLSSLEPQTVTDELIATVAGSNGRLCRYFHIPMQSGSSRILRLMRRPYDRDGFIERVAAIRTALPEVVIGADVIVGFPGETDRDFEDTAEIATSGLIDYLHVFSYSDRPGTTAFDMPDKAPLETIRARHGRLIEISRRRWQLAHQRQVGSVLEVIAEHKRDADGVHWAVADNYIRVRLPGRIDSRKEIVKVRITAAHEDWAEGDVQ